MKTKKLSDEEIMCLKEKIGAFYDNRFDKILGNQNELDRKLNIIYTKLLDLEEAYKGDKMRESIAEAEAKMKCAQDDYIYARSQISEFMREQRDQRGYFLGEE